MQKNKELNEQKVHMLWPGKYSAMDTISPLIHFKCISNLRSAREINVHDI